MQLLVGTSGYSYKAWKGSFYPKELPDKQMLRYYGERFRTVEINSTFMKVPKEETLKSWKAEVPRNFTFVLKAPRRITHMRKLKDAGEAVDYFLKASAALGKQLGPLLFQLPPFLQKDLPRLRDFLALLPKKRRVAFEFRHQSWYDDEVYDLLRSHGAALCLAEVEDNLDIPFVATASWGYLRLRRHDYSDSKLRAWVKRVRKQDWTEAFVFFRHEDEGKGPKFAARFLELSA